MVHADRGALARLAAGELQQAERERLELHLGDCRQCADVLAQLETTRTLLRQGLAAPVPPVDWARVDGAVQEAVTRELARQHRRPLWPLGLVAAGAAVALALVLAPRLSPPPAPAPQQVAEAPAVPAPQEAGDTRVEHARHTRVVRPDASTVALAEGDALDDGVRVRTERRGHAVLQLPDASRAHLGEAAEVQVVRADRDDVALALARGRLTVQASHVERRGFVVQSGGVRVHVVGTAFSVLAEGGRVEVAVLEGRVRVETGRGPPQLVGAGERLATRAHGRTSRVGLAEADRAAFRALGLSVSPARPRAQVAEALPGAAPALPPEALPAPAPGPVPTSPSALDEEADAVAAVQGPRPFAPDVPSMLVPVPPAEATEAPHGVQTEELLPRSAEEQFLTRARESLQTGRCEAFLLGLEELTEQPGAPIVRQEARFLRARCFEERVMPLEAEREYLRYLRDFPAGPHAGTARAALE